MTQIRTRSRPSPQNSAPTPANDTAPKTAPATQELQGREAVIYVTRALYDGNRVVSEHEAEERIRVPLFGSAVAEVEVEGSVTRNLGNFNSCRVACRVKLPAYAEISEIDRAYLLASNLVDRYVERELNIATGVADPSDPLPEV